MTPQTYSITWFTTLLTGAGFAATSGTFYLPSINTDRPKLVVLYSDTTLKLWDIKTEEVLTSIRLMSIARSTAGAEDEDNENASVSVFCMAQPHLGTELVHQQSDLVVVGGLNCLLMAVLKADKQTASFSSKVSQFFIKNYFRHSFILGRLNLLFIEQRNCIFM